MTDGHELVRTRAGAVAVRCRVTGEVMHPGVGPLVEAEELYVKQSRLAEQLATATRPLVLFDVGLGAASNALAARAVSERAPADRPPLELVSFERDLGALVLALAHGADFGLAGEPAEAARALLARGAQRTPRTHWQLRRGDLLEALAEERERADVVFWDPYSPRANPELWTIAAFAALRRVAAARCTVYTYSASTATRVALLLAGWSVGIGDRIGGKAETTAAAACVDDLARPLERRWLGRLAKLDAPLPADAPARGEVAARVGALAQFA